MICIYPSAAVLVLWICRPAPPVGGVSATYNTG